MSTMREKLSRRGFLAVAGSVSVAAAIDAPPQAHAAPLPLESESAEKAGEAVARQIVDALEGAYGVHPGLRRNHTKGVGVLGTFVGNPEARAYSHSLMFSGEEIPVVARFSVAGGNPHASDTEKTPRGVGLEFRLPNGGLQHMTMLHTPMFFAHVPKTFLDKFIALKRDPATGKPVPGKYEAFQKSHPDTASQDRFLAHNNPPPSYTDAAYYSIHAFKFVDAAGKETLVKWRFVPQDGEKRLTEAELKANPANFLDNELTERLRRGPARWDMIVTLGEPGDPDTDPTLLWPANRKEFNAGTLTLSSAIPDQQAGSYNINYDPLVLADGIAATNDPVLLIRSSSYAISYTRRLQQV